MNTLLEPMNEPQSANQLDAEAVPALPDVSPRTLLVARGVRKAFGGHLVLDGVDIELRQGEVVLLRGENGSGKTTLLNILTGNLEPDSGAIEYSADDSPRTYHFPRRWWQELNPWDHFRPEFVASEGLGRTWQDTRLFGAQSLRDNIGVAMPRQPGENPALVLLTPGRVQRAEREIRERADAMLAQLGLEGRERSSADKISLGQSKRVAIARAVAAGTRILFLDEPLAGLDQQGIRNVLDLLESIVRDHSVTLVIVEHVFNLPQLAYLATSDWLLEGGKLTSSKTAPAPEQRLESLLVRQPMRPGWFHLLLDKDSQVIDEPLPRGAILTRIRSTKPNSGNPKPVLEIRNLMVQRGSRVVIGLDDERELSGFNLSLHQGEIAILQAPNGWGKTSLAEAITGLTEIAEGQIIFAGHEVQDCSVWERSRYQVHFVRSREHLFPRLTVQETLKISGVRDIPPYLQPLLRRRVSQLSGGERQKLCLALIPSQARITILDEPFSALSEHALLDVLRCPLFGPNSAGLILLPTTTTSTLF